MGVWYNLKEYFVRGETKFMAKDNKILATYVTYKTLYKDKRTDVYDIVSEFVKYVIL